MNAPAAEDEFDAAARWLARLHAGPLGDREAAALKAWIAADPRHAAALDAVSTAWTRAGDLCGAPALTAERRRALTLRLADAADLAPAANDDAPPRHRPRWRGLAAAAAVAGLVVTAQPPPAQAFETARGQTLRAVLADGSVIALNTASRAEVDYGWFGTTVTITEGEAEVTPARGLHRPLTVRVNEAELDPEASVAVRKQGETSTVTAVAGPVAVNRPGAPPLALAAATSGTLRPGAPARLAAVQPAAVLAWQRGQVVFDSVTLAGALAEFRRYGEARISVDPRLAPLTVSGAYRTSDLAAFLEALPAIHPVRVEQRSDGSVRIAPADGPRA
jgi:transmembrane sensor